MKAAVLYGKEDLRVEEAPEPTPRSGQLKLRVGFAGICGSDVHTFFAPESNTFLPREPHPLTGATMPQIQGHEFSGTVVEIGEGVTGIAVGDRGAVHPTVQTCGICSACRRGMSMACKLLVSTGTNANGGGLAEFVVINASQFRKFPENVSLRMGALVEPMAVGWHGVERAGVQPGGTALVIGAGPIGIGTWYALRAHGVDKVLVSEPSRERREAIAALGAQVIDPFNADLAAAVEELTGGDGLDTAVDAAGAGPAFTGGVGGLAPGGRLVVVAVHEQPLEFQPTELMLTEKEILGAVGHTPEDFDGIIAAMSQGLYDTEGWVSERPLEDVVEAIHSLRAGIGSKILIRID